MRLLIISALTLIALMLSATACIWSVLWFDMWSAQKKQDIKPIVMHIYQPAYVSLVNGAQVEYDIKEGK